MITNTETIKNEQDDANKQGYPTKVSFDKISVCLGLAFYWVIFLWGFWRKDIFALGINAFVFLSLVTLFFLYLLHNNKKRQKSDLSWIIPIFLLNISYILYENPFFKETSLLIYPCLFALFYNYAGLNEKLHRYWNLTLLTGILKRIFSFLPSLIKSFEAYINLIVPKSNGKKNIFVKSFVGLILLAIISFTVIIPLLSSADAMFAEKMQNIMQWFNSLISATVLVKTIFFAFMSIFLLSLVLAWSKEFDYAEPEEQAKNVDSIISGIVMGGILAIYLLFLWIQFSRLWVGSLPFEFKETESLVKSGFWQLLGLSIINIAIYFFAYKKIELLIHKILTVFTVTSLLLLISAGHRMALYAIYYGFSYEKFYASYTVLFCSILFVWLISRLFVSKRSNIVKFLLFLFLWMYSLVSIFPVEQIIVRANTSMVKLKNSQIRLYEMTMLSPDVLSLIKKYQAAGLLEERAGIIYRENTDNQSKKFDWASWVKKQEDRVLNKPWYELNLSNILYLN